MLLLSNIPLVFLVLGKTQETHNNTRLLSTDMRLYGLLRHTTEQILLQN